VEQSLLRPWELSASPCRLLVNISYTLTIEASMPVGIIAVHSGHENRVGEYPFWSAKNISTRGPTDIGSQSQITA